MTVFLLTSFGARFMRRDLALTNRFDNAGALFYLYSTTCSPPDTPKGLGRGYFFLGAQVGH